MVLNFIYNTIIQKLRNKCTKETLFKKVSTPSLFMDESPSIEYQYLVQYRNTFIRKGEMATSVLY